MSEPDPLLDELLSAHLDGETTADESALLQRELERDSTLRERYDQLAAAREASRQAFLSDVTSLDDSQRDSVLDHVLAEFDRDPTSDESTPADDEHHPTLTPITQLTKRRRDPSRFLAAAAAIVAVVLLGGAIAMLVGESGRNGSDDSASAPDSAGAEMSTHAAESDAGDGGVEQGGGSAESSSTMRASALGDLGTYDDAQALDQVVRALLDESTRAADATTPTVTPANPPRSQSSPSPDGGNDSAFSYMTCVEPEGTTAYYHAVVDGQPVFVVLLADHAVVLDQHTCTEVLRITPH